MQKTDEILKTLRFSHQLLMLLATAVFLFAATHDPTPDYNAALDELGALRRTTDSLSDYAQYIYDRFRTAHSGDEDYLLEVVKQAGGYVRGTSEFRQPFACDCVPAAFSLSGYDAFLSGLRAFAPIHIDHNKNLPDQLKTQIATQKPHAGFRYVRASVNGVSGSYQLPDGTPVLRLSDPTPHETTIQFYFEDPQSEGRPSFSANVFITYSVGPRQEGTFALDWLRSTRQLDRLVDPKSGVVFPHLKKLSSWSRFSSLGIEQATTSVQAELEHTETGKVSFLGISVDKTLAVWFGPSVCFAVLIFFLLHLRHFYSLIDSSEIDTSFPWIPLFPDAFSGVFSFVSVLALPTLANFLLLVRYGNAGQWNTRIGALVTAGIIGLGIWSWSVMQRIRVRVRLSGSQ